MIAFLRGEVVSVGEKSVLLDVNNVGFAVAVSARDAMNMPPAGETVTVYTHMSVREDDISLFGFLSEEDLAVYRMLIAVNGVGPKAALGILSAMTAGQLKLAVLTDDEKLIAKAPGIGAKTAKKVILELKDKMKPEDLLTLEEDSGAASGNREFEANKEEAVQVLTALGYSRSEAVRAVRGAKLTEDMDADQILTAALSDRRKG